MAVIKIVPMPGAKGDKGDDGATGAQGLQGPIGETGPAGADALWSYNGAWQSNATYAEGDLVTHDGQLYYATGVTTLGVTPDSDSNFDLIAAKGEQGIAGTSLITSGTWDTKFVELNGIDVGTDVTSNSYIYNENHKFGTYYCVGDLVYWDFRYIMSTPLSWGTSNAWVFQLPFPQYYDLPAATPGVSALRNILNRTVANGWFRVLADEDPTPFLPLLTEENTYSENESHHLIANCIIRTYPLDTETGLYTFTGTPNSATIWPAEDPKVGVAFIVASNQEPEGDELVIGYPGNPRTIGYKNVGSTWPANLVGALADNTDEIPANNASESSPLGNNSNVIQFNFSGVYRRA